MARDIALARAAVDEEDTAAGATGAMEKRFTLEQGDKESAVGTLEVDDSVVSASSGAVEPVEQSRAGGGALPLSEGHLLTTSIDPADMALRRGSDDMENIPPAEASAVSNNDAAGDDKSCTAVVGNGGNDGDNTTQEEIKGENGAVSNVGDEVAPAGGSGERLFGWAAALVPEPPVVPAVGTIDDAVSADGSRGVVANGIETLGGLFVDFETSFGLQSPFGSGFSFSSVGGGNRGSGADDAGDVAGAVACSDNTGVDARPGNSSSVTAAPDKSNGGGGSGLDALFAKATRAGSENSVEAAAPVASNEVVTPPAEHPSDSSELFAELSSNPQVHLIAVLWWIIQIASHTQAFTVSSCVACRC